jgi:hypothetical protein
MIGIQKKIISRNLLVIQTSGWLHYKGSFFLSLLPILVDFNVDTADGTTNIQMVSDACHRVLKRVVGYRSQRALCRRSLIGDRCFSSGRQGDESH